MQQHLRRVIKMMHHVTTHDNGAAFCVCMDGLVIAAFSTLGAAWKHIVWMHTIASQQFVVGPNKTPVREWMAAMYRAGWMDDNIWCKAAYLEHAAATDANMIK